MPLTPDYLPAGDARAERGVDWHTILALFVSVAGSTMALNAILRNEKATAVLALAMASAMLAWSVVSNHRRRRIGSIVMNAFSAFCVAAAFVLVVLLWR
jgi:hypothetical protein